MFVVTADQRGSRTRPDAVPALLDALAGHLATRPGGGSGRHLGGRGIVRPFERTAGDEVQALLDDPAVVVEVLVELVRQGGWWVGIGVGAVATPLPATARAGRGDAYVAARQAVDSAKSTTAGVCVRGGSGAVEAESAAWLLAWLLGRRTPEGWEVVELMTPGARQVDVAAKLAVSPQAVSSRLRVAGWQEQQRGEALLASLLARADRPASPAS